MSWQTSDARYSHYHAFGRIYLNQYKIQIWFQISKITNELYNNNDSKSLLAPGFSVPPGIPDCTDPSLCRSSPPGALQNAFPAILQAFLSSPLGGRALLFPRSPTFPHNSLAERLSGQIWPFFCTSALQDLYSVLACQPLTPISYSSLWSGMIFPIHSACWQPI